MPASAWKYVLRPGHVSKKREGFPLHFATLLRVSDGGMSGQPAL
jgi:hypothetical protein